MTPYVHPQRMRARWMAAIWTFLAGIALVFQMRDELPGVAVAFCVTNATIWLAAEWLLVVVRDWEDR